MNAGPNTAGAERPVNGANMPSAFGNACVCSTFTNVVETAVIFAEVLMNGGHDLGGMHGFGPIHAEAEAREPVFHADWEKRVFGLVRVLGALGLWNGDMSRHARERQHPMDYLRHSYYENWL